MKWNKDLLLDKYSTQIYTYSRASASFLQLFVGCLAMPTIITNSGTTLTTHAHAPVLQMVFLPNPKIVEIKSKHFDVSAYYLVAHITKRYYVAMMANKNGEPDIVYKRNLYNII